MLSGDPPLRPYQTDHRPFQPLLYLQGFWLLSLDTLIPSISLCPSSIGSFPVYRIVEASRAEQRLRDTGRGIGGGNDKYVIALYAIHGTLQDGPLGPVGRRRIRVKIDIFQEEHRRCRLFCVKKSFLERDKEAFVAGILTQYSTAPVGFLHKSGSQQALTKPRF